MSNPLSLQDVSTDPRSPFFGGDEMRGCDIMEILAVHLVPLHNTWMHCKSLGCTEASVWMQIGAVQTGDERERGA